MKTFITICSLFALVGGLVFGAGTGEDGAVQSEAAVLKELVALESAALDGWYGESDAALYAQQFADKATYFDPWAPGRTDDGAIKKYVNSFTGKVPKINYEIHNPRVDLYGDTAIFTFNLTATLAKDGAATGWNTTLVYTRTKDGWEKVHANWAYTAPGN